MYGRLTLLTLLTLMWTPTTLLAAVRPEPDPPPEVSHQPTLLWTETGLQKRIQVVGIIGQPSDWIRSRSPRIIGEMSESEWNKYQHSSRRALSFQHSTQTLFWSDLGFKEIHRTRLKRENDLESVHNLTVDVVYAGTSQQVNGLAVDWLSGSVYWSDALYNWIAVASGYNTDIYRPLVTTDLDSPMGLVVHPRLGLMFWNSWGAVPKIEVASLAGENRSVFIDQAIDRPLGMAIDYDTDMLYWVDDFLDTIDCIRLDGTGRHAIYLSSMTPNGPSKLYGLALYQDYLFVTDQLYKTIRIFNKTSDEHIQNVFLGRVPYDIIMYSAEAQENITSECPTLGCHHICVGEGEGRGRCLCSQGYDLDTDGVTCLLHVGIREPMYLYTTGTSLCGTDTNVADRDLLDPSQDVTCSFATPTLTLALAADVHGENVFFSDGHDGVIYRRRLRQGGKTDIIAVQTGYVRGMAVDWLSANLYYTDAILRQIMVSRLDGRYPAILCEDIGTPRGIAVNPTKGKMYWVDVDAEVIWYADMDCTNRKIFVDRVIGGDGVGLDVIGGRLYWAQRAGIISANLQGEDKQSLVTDFGYTFRDVTVYQDYFAWTDGRNGIYFGVKSTGKVLRGFRHIEAKVSHDIVGYSAYLQPPAQGPCDVENGECEQLCLPTPTGRRCWCGLGFTLNVDNITCVSDIQRGRFLLLVDPYHRDVYQLDLTTSDPCPQAVGLRAAEFPTVADVDTKSEEVYWVDQRAGVIMSKPLLGGPETQVLHLGRDVTIPSLVVHSASRQLLFIQTTPTGGAIYVTSFTSGDKSVLEVVDKGSTLTLHERSGILYWTSKTTNGTWAIYRKSLHAAVLSKEKIGESGTQISDISVSYSDDLLYWSTATAIWRSTLEGENPDVVHFDHRANFSSLAVVNGYVYCSHWNKRSLFRLNLETLKEENVTDPCFSRITSVREYWRLPPKPKPTTATPVVRASSDQEETKILWGMSLPVVTGIGTAFLLLLIVIATLSCVLIARKRRRKKTPQAALPSTYTAPAHDNPTYVTTEFPPLAEPVYDAIPAQQGAPQGAVADPGEDSQNSDLPDIIMTKQGIPLPERPDLGPTPPQSPAEGAVLETCTGPESETDTDNVVVSSDREELVPEATVPVEVAVNVHDPTDTHNSHL